jgi:hypothetical protein
VSISGAAPYVGQGNVSGLSGANEWYGLRAWTTAYATAHNKLFNARNGTTAETCDFLAATSGGVGVAANCSGSSNGASLATFAGAATLFATKVYNQTVNGGGAYDMVQATQAQQPAIILSCLNSLPCLNTSNAAMITGTIENPATPYTWESVAGRFSGTAASTVIIGDATVAYFDTVTGQWDFYNNAAASVATQSTGVVHDFAVSVAGTGGSSTQDMYTDGANTHSAIGNNGNAGPAVTIGNASNADSVHWFEGGRWPTAVTGTCHNPRLYWGFPGASC